MRFLLSTLVNGVAIWLTSLLLDGIHMELPDDFWRGVLYVGVVSVIFTVVTIWVKPVVKVLSIPLLLLTLGLFFFVINALMLMLTAWISGLIGFGLTVDSFWWALGGSILISIFGAILNAVLPEPRD